MRDNTFTLDNGSALLEVPDVVSVDDVNDLEQWFAILVRMLRRAATRGDDQVDVDGLRPCVKRFADEMENALRRHDDDRGPRGWECDEPAGLIDRVRDETVELDAAIRADPPSPAEVRDEAVDVAIFAMMIHDLSSE